LILFAASLDELHQMGIDQVPAASRRPVTRSKAAGGAAHTNQVANAHRAIHVVQVEQRPQQRQQAPINATRPMTRSCAAGKALKFRL